jgi:hypothetical protein
MRLAKVEAIATKSISGDQTDHTREHYFEPMTPTMSSDADATERSQPAEIAADRDGAPMNLVHDDPVRVAEAEASDVCSSSKATRHAMSGCAEPLSQTRDRSSRTPNRRVVSRRRARDR